MHRYARTVPPLAAFLLALIVPTVAAGAEPDWSSEWKAGLEEAKERNCPIIIVAPFKRGTFKPATFPTAFNDPAIIKLCDRFVSFYADDARYPNVDTVYAAKYVKPDSGKYGSLQVIICKSDGTEFEKLRLTDLVTKTKLVKNMNTALKSYREAISRQEYRLCAALRDRAELLRSLGAYAEAIRNYEQLAKMNSRLKFVKAAEKRSEEVEKEAVQKVEEAAKILAEGDAEQKKDAVKRLHIYSYGMKKLDIHGKVRDLLAQAKKDKALSEEYGRSAKNAKAFEQFIKGELAYFEGNYKDAMSAYRRITRSYDETEYYDMAKVRIQEIVDKLTPKKKSTTP